MAEVLADRWTSIELEPFDGFKIEFSGQRADGVAEHHQAKRLAPNGRAWSLALLEREGIGFKELLIILVIALLVFGGKKLRSLGGDLGSAVRGFKKAMNDGDTDESAKQLKHMEGDAEFQAQSKSPAEASKSSAK